MQRAAQQRVVPHFILGAVLEVLHVGQLEDHSALPCRRLNLAHKVLVLLPGLLYGFVLRIVKALLLPEAEDQQHRQHRGKGRPGFAGALGQPLFCRKAHGEQREEDNVRADAVVPADEADKNADDAAKAGQGGQQQRHNVQPAEQPDTVAQFGALGAAGLPIPVTQQHQDQKQKSDDAHDAEIAVAVLVVHGAFVGGEDLEVALDPPRQLADAKAVGRKQQTADAQAVDVRTHRTAVDAVGDGAANPHQLAQHHGEEIRHHPGDDLADGDQAGHGGLPGVVTQHQAEGRNAEEEAGKVRVVGRAVVGDAPGHSQSQPVAFVFEEAFAGLVKIEVLCAPEAEQDRERHKLHGGQHHVAAQALLHIGTQAEGHAEAVGQPPAHAHHAEYRVPGQRIGKGDNQDVQVEHRAGILGKQAHKGHKNVVDKVIIRLVGAGGLVERPPQGAGQLAKAALDLAHPVDAVAAVEHGHLPIQPPELEKPVFRQRNACQQQHHCQSFAQNILFFIQHSVPFIPRAAWRPRKHRTLQPRGRPPAGGHGRSR